MTGAGPEDDAVLVTADFAECYRIHYPRVIRALQLSGADPPTAEDVAQEAFARALVHWRRVRKGTNPPGYVYRSAFRGYARRVPRREVDLPESLESDGDPQGAVVTRLTVEDALARMAPRQRLCATACLVVGMSTAEAAAALGVAEGTVRKQLALASVDLRRVL